MTEDMTEVEIAKRTKAVLFYAVKCGERLGCPGLDPEAIYKHWEGRVAALEAAEKTNANEKEKEKERERLRTENIDLRDANRKFQIDCDSLRVQNCDLHDATERLTREAKAAWRVRPPCDCERLRAVNKKLRNACRSALSRFSYLEAKAIPSSTTKHVLRKAIAEAESGSQADEAR